MGGGVPVAAGSTAPADPFTPVLRGILPSRLRWYVEAPLTGGQGDATRISAIPLWSPALRFHTRFLAPHLEPAVSSSGADHLDEPVLEGVAHELGAR